MGVVSINQHGNLYFYFRYNGRRYREGTGLKDTPPNRAKAEKYIKLINAELAAGVFDYPKRFPHGNETQIAETPAGVTFREYSTRWLAEHAPPDKSNKKPTPDGFLRSSTYKDYQNAINSRLLPVFGDIPLSEISKGLVRTFQKTITGVGTQRVRNIIMPLRSIFRTAYEDGLVQDNPMEQVRHLKSHGGTQREISPFDLAEVRAMRDYLPRYWSLWFTVQVFTGMRTAEWLGLKWKRVDFSAGIIQIRETFTSHGVWEAPKTAGSRREITLLAPALDALHQIADDYSQGRRVRSPLVFPNSDGGPWCENNVINRLWKPAIETLKLPSRTPYTTRHTFASMLLKETGDLAYIASQMGTSIQMLSKTYARWIKGGQRDYSGLFAEIANPLAYPPNEKS